jgi:hypothetical protein
VTVSQSIAVGEVERVAAPAVEPTPERAPVIEVVPAEAVTAGMVLEGGTLVVDAWWSPSGLRVIDVGERVRWVLAPEHQLRVVRS